jgi:hypothetical protein
MLAGGRPEQRPSVLGKAGGHGHPPNCIQSDHQQARIRRRRRHSCCAYRRLNRIPWHRQRILRSPPRCSQTGMYFQHRGLINYKTLHKDTFTHMILPIESLPAAKCLKKLTQNHTEPQIAERFTSWDSAGRCSRSPTGTEAGTVMVSEEWCAPSTALTPGTM